MNTILMVAYNMTNLVLLRQLINRVTDCETVLFTDAAAALSRLETADVDLILVDHAMPTIDGIAFTRRVRQMQRHATVPVMMMTASGARTATMPALEAGVTDFLTKPLEPIEFQVRVRNLLDLRRAQKQLAARAALLDREVAIKTSELVEREREIIWRLAKAIERRDADTGDHIARMARICGILAEGLGYAEEDCRLIEMAAQMHDVGKIGIADEILFKPGALTSEERRVMETHTDLGWTILEGSKSRLLQMAADIAVSHHEKWDGTGYPKGLAGEEIPMVGRITALADVFDALMSVRPYKPAWPREKAVAFIAEGRGKHFDPACVDTFFGHIDAIASIAGTPHGQVTLAAE